MLQVTHDDEDRGGGAGEGLRAPEDRGDRGVRELFEAQGRQVGRRGYRLGMRSGRA